MARKAGAYRVGRLRMLKCGTYVWTVYSRSRAVDGPEALDRRTLAENASVCPRMLRAEGVRGTVNNAVQNGTGEFEFCEDACE